MSKPVCIFGETLFDCYPDGHEVLGGAPFNVAWHLQAFGQSPILVTRIGNDDRGGRILAAMADWGLQQQGLQIDPRHPTGHVVITLDQGQPSYEIATNSAYEFISPDFLPPVTPGLIYHGSLAPYSPVSRAALAAMKSRANARIIVDVNLRRARWRHEALQELLSEADWVKLNGDELAILGETGADVEAAMRFSETHRLEGVVLTLGADGAIAVVADREPVRVRPEFATDVVDAVGAGDAFAAVLILGFQLGWALSTTLERAQEFASELVRVRGATVSDPAFYQPFRRRWCIMGS